MRGLRFTIASIVAMSAATPALASIVCSGQVANLALGPTGIVQANYGYGWHYLCSLTAIYGDYTPQACQGLYSMLLTAQASGCPVLFFYNQYAACSDIGSWLMPTPQPYFIQIDQ